MNHPLAPALFLLGGLSVGLTLGAIAHATIDVDVHVAAPAVLETARVPPRQERVRRERSSRRHAVVVVDEGRLRSTRGDVARDFGARALLVPGEGYRITGVRGETLAAELGLRNGDIVRAVNGRSLNAMDDLFALWDDLGEQRVFDVELEREGVDERIRYVLK